MAWETLDKSFYIFPSINIFSMLCIAKHLPEIFRSIYSVKGIERWSNYPIDFHCGVTVTVALMICTCASLSLSVSLLFFRAPFFCIKTEKNGKSENEIENLLIIDGFHTIHKRNELNEQTSLVIMTLACVNDVPKLFNRCQTANGKRKCEKYKAIINWNDVNIAQMAPGILNTEQCIFDNYAKITNIPCDTQYLIGVLLLHTDNNIRIGVREAIFSCGVAHTQNMTNNEN